MNLLKDYLPQEHFENFEDLQNFQISVPHNFNFGYDVVDKYAATDPDKLAIVWCDDKGEEKFITFKDIALNSNKIANMLYAKGIRAGDHVLIMLMSRYEYWYTVIALHKLGAIAIPATSQLTYKDIEYRCNYASIKAIISVNLKNVVDYINKALPKCPTVKYVITVGDGDKTLNFDAECANHNDKATDFDFKNKASDPMIAYFTSGTTGMPKMVTHPHSYTLAHIATAYLWHRCTDGGIHFTAADTGWAKASWGKIYGQWLCGSAIFAYDYYGKYTPLDLLPLLAKYKVTTFCAPPTMYRFLIKEDLRKYDLSNINHYCTAGEPLNPAVYDQIKAQTHMPIFEGFGQTEATLILGTYMFVQPKPGSMGKPSPLYDVCLMNEKGEEVATGQEGEICIRVKENQLGLFLGYHLDDKRTQNVWRDGIYHTGDVACKDQDGYYWFVGRDDDIIKSSGYRIGPFEVESALLEHPAVMECAITAIPDDVRGQIIKATIVLARNYFPSEELKKELQNHVKHTTAPYKYPRIIEFVHHLPKTISEKIRRVEIRQNDNTTTKK